MSQCSALYYARGSKCGEYCVLPEGHWGGHVTDRKFRFSEDEATYLAKTAPIKKSEKGGE